MERLITILCFVALFAAPSFAQEAKPMDIPSLELLIKFHKDKYKKLEERNKQEIGHSTMSSTVANVTKNYEELHKELSARYSMLSAWGTTAISTLRLAKEVKDTFPLLNTFIEYTRHLKNIHVIKEYANTIEVINLECKYLSSTIKKIPLLRANAAEITEVIMELQARVSSINRYLNNCIFMVEGYVALQNIGYNTSPIDKARIANKIILDFSKK